MKVLKDNGLQMSAVHNHTTSLVPDLIILHGSGTGDSTAMAVTLRNALNQRIRKARRSSITPRAQAKLAIAPAAAPPRLVPFNTVLYGKRDLLLPRAGVKQPKQENMIRSAGVSRRTWLKRSGQ